MRANKRRGAWACASTRLDFTSAEVQRMRMRTCKTSAWNCTQRLLQLACPVHHSCQSSLSAHAFRAACQHVRAARETAPGRTALPPGGMHLHRKAHKTLRRQPAERQLRLTTGVLPLADSPRECPAVSAAVRSLACGTACRRLGGLLARSRCAAVLARPVVAFRLQRQRKWLRLRLAARLAWSLPAVWRQ